MSADNDTLQAPDELSTLKARATLLGLTFHPSIGLDKLREKVAEALASTDPAPVAQKVAAAPVLETAGQRRVRQKRTALALVRIRVTCMNPAKKEWDGEIFTVGNATLGSVRKFVPFNADEGWHVPHVIYEVMKDRQCQVFVTSKDARGNVMRKGKLIKEFAIEVLDQLTQAELDEMARRQAMSKAID
jgi:hypothetical protein